MSVTRQNFVKTGSIYITQAGASLGDLHMNSCHRQDRKLVTCCRTASLCTRHFKTSSVLRFSRLDPTHLFFGLVIFFSSCFGQCCREPSLGTNFPKLGMTSVMGPLRLSEIKQTDVSSFGRNVTVEIESDNAVKIQLNLKITSQLFLLHSTGFIFL